MGIDRAAIIAYAQGITGFFEPVEMEGLLAATLELEDGDRIVEIGTFHGRSSSIFLQVVKVRPLHVTLIDDWSVDGDDARRSLMKIIAEIDPPADRYAIRPVKSWIASMDIDPGLGLVFIDGEHSPAAVRSDTMNFLPKIRPGGFACFHDYRRPDGKGGPEVFPGVTAAVDEFTRGWERVGIFDTLYVARKPEVGHATA